MFAQRFMAGRGLVIIMVMAGSLFTLGACDSAPQPGVEVIRYSGPPITSESVQHDGVWVASIDSIWRQVTLELVEPDSSVRHRLSLQEIEGELPVFAGYAHRSGSANSGTLRSGTIQIQEFSLDGEVSGVIEGHLSRPVGTRIGSLFFVDLRDEHRRAAIE